MRVAVIGGGISGLSAAWELRTECDVVVFERGQLGGCVRTSALDGIVVEEGPDAFLTRTPDAVNLAEELGLVSNLISPTTSRAAVWWRDELIRLPEGLVLGAPTRMWELARSGLISPLGLARAAMEIVLPRSDLSDSDTVYDLISRRFGREIAEKLVDPLVGSIHAGRITELSAVETVPQLVAAARDSRSLLSGLRRARPSASSVGAFLAPKLGLGTLVSALADRTSECGVEFISEAVGAVRALESGQLMVGSYPDPFEAAVIALPPSQASQLFEGELRDHFGAIPMASVAIVNTVLKSGSVPPDLSGFLVPESLGCLMTACSFASNKWPTRSLPDRDVVRLSAGRYRDDRASRLDDEAVCDRVIEELSRTLKQDLSVTAVSIARWPESLPQYLPGHSRRVQAIRDLLHRLHPRLELAGAGYEGTGIPACISSARRAARSILGTRDRDI